MTPEDADKTGRSSGEPLEAVPRAARLIEAARRHGEVARGVLEVTRAVERGDARIVFIARDFDRVEVVSTLRSACAATDVPVVDRYLKADLGRWAGIQRPSAALGVLRIADRAAFLAETLDGAPGAATTLGGVQRLGASVEPKDGAAAAARRARCALDVLEAADRTAHRQAAAMLLRATVQLANSASVDLQALIDGWTTAEWLAEDA
jgi:large subunit ribosomal protein L7Ae